MDVLKSFTEARKALYDHVGFVEDWVIYPIEDNSDMFWELRKDCVIYSESKMEVINEDGDYYRDTIYTQRFYDKHVYEGKKYTLVFCDPHVDGMKWFRIFDNEKRIYE